MDPDIEGAADTGPSADAAPDAHRWTVNREIRCARCSFDLRGHPIEGKCPECGTPVAFSCASPATSGYAIASMVLGIVSIITCVAYGLPSLVCGVLAIVFRNVAIKQIVTGRASASSKSMATAGFVCGIIGIATFVVWAAFLVFFVVAGTI